MEYRPLHIDLKSADGLKDVKLFSKMDVYAEVSIAGYPQSKKRTRVDKNCGTSPKWKDARMEFMVDEPYLTKPGISLLFQLKAESSLGSDKDVGSATVPVHDLFGPDSAQEKTTEYQLHTPAGKPKGSLKFSYRFGDKFSPEPAPAKPQYAPDPTAAKHQYAPDPVTAYPAAGSSAYPAPGGAYPGPGMGYPPAQPGYGYGYGYQGPPPPQAGYGYQGPPPQAGYGYQGPPPPAGYGYAPYGQPQKPKKNKMGMGGGLGMGLGAGLLGGMLVGDMIGEADGYADGYGDAMDMGGDFDF